MLFKIYDKSTNEYIGTMKIRMEDVRKYEKEFILIRG